MTKSISEMVWIVMESIDYDSQDVAAVYTRKALADEHAEEMGGWVRECEVVDVLVSEVTDPVKRQQRRDAIDRSRREYQARQSKEKRIAEQRANMKPFDRMMLCHCAVFSPTYNWINAHGYCSFCGGFVVSAFRNHLGESALQAAIDKLAIHDRERMREIAAATP